METVVIGKNGRPASNFPVKPINSPIKIEAYNYEPIGFFVSRNDYEIVRRFHINRLKETMDRVSKRTNLTEAQMEALLAKDD